MISSRIGLGMKVSSSFFKFLNIFGPNSPMAFFHTIETQLSLKPSYAFVSMFPHYEISGLRCEESLNHGLGLLILLE